MLRFLSILILVTLLAAGSKPQESWRQKLTVVIETPQGEVSGSAVVEVDGDMRQQPGMANEINCTPRGEATVV